MTRTEYGARVTAIIDEFTGGGFEFPDTFDDDVSLCFMRRISPGAAAEALLSEYQSEDE